MKILFITSFYSSIQASILEDSWAPTGMPAITKLFEQLKLMNIDFDNIFIDSNSKINQIYNIKNSYFNNSIHVIEQSKKKRPKYIRNLIQGFYYILLYKQIKKIISKRGDYDLFYVDRSNILIAGLLKLSGKKVILRLHGVSTFYEEYSKFYTKLLNPITTLSLRSSFNYIICTNDGSPGKKFINKFTNSKVPSTILLNGIDNRKFKSNINTKLNNISNEMPIILFVGRLSEDKGINEFINTIYKLQKSNKNFKTIIIGDGNDTNFIKQKVIKYNLRNIIFTGAIKHKDIYDYFNIADIYISLNKLGNLSNTVLEAINAEKCIITLKKDQTTLRDESTNNFLKDSALYIDRNNIESELLKILKMLLNNKNLIKEQEKKIKRTKKKLIDWDRRIKKEVNILYEVFD